MQLASSGERAKVNQAWQTAFARMKPEGDFANSNRSRYLKGQSKEPDLKNERRADSQGRMSGGESKTANRICIEGTEKSNLANSTKASHPDRQPTEEELKNVNATGPVRAGGMEKDGSWAPSLYRWDRPNEALL
jgi:hypothetical protein